MRRLEVRIPAPDGVSDGALHVPDGTALAGAPERAYVDDRRPNARRQDRGGRVVIDVCRVVDGRIVEHWGVPDRFAALAQTGVLDRLAA